MLGVGIQGAERPTEHSTPSVERARSTEIDLHFVVEMTFYAPSGILAQSRLSV